MFDNTTKQWQKLSIVLLFVQHQKKIISGKTTKRRHQLTFMLPSYNGARSYVATWNANQFLLVDVTESQNSVVLC